jgi:hypothetical protein
VINNFGAKVNGAANDGIDLGVPKGTPVRAADDGVVAYAGNDLKGYGNLVLVRHANGFVTAYANASELMVKRNDQVHKGRSSPNPARPEPPRTRSFISRSAKIQRRSIRCSTCRPIRRVATVVEA